MSLIITIGLICIIVALASYAIYLKFRAASAKGRFAVYLASSMLLVIPTTIMAIGQFNFSHSAISFILLLTGGPAPNEYFSLASKALDYFLISVLCIVCTRHLYRFGQTTIDNWDGPPTTLDLRLLSAGEHPDIFTVAREYAALRASGKSDVAIDERELDPTIELSDTPPNPQWDSFSRELILEAFNEVTVPEGNWSTDLNCWFGTFAPLSSPTHLSNVAVIPAHTELTPGDALSYLGDRSNDVSRVFVCVDLDDTIDKSEQIDDINVRILSRSKLLALGLNLRGYCEDLIDRFGRDRILGTDLSLSDIYVEPSLKSEGNVEGLPFSSVIDSWASSNTREQLSLVGEFGQGKSSAILRYCARWAESYLANPDIPHRIPLLIPLRGRDPSTLTRQNFLAAWGTQYRLSGRALLNLVVAGRAILFFEGFDEVNNAGLRSQRIAQFDALWRFSFPKAKLAFTGRPNFFLDDKEMRRLLRVDEIVAASGQPFTSIYSFQFFSRQMIVEALRPFPAETASEIVAHFDSDPAFRDVASRPSMLPLIALTWREIKQRLRDTGRVTSARIIANYIEFEYRRKEAEVEEEQKRHGLTKQQNYLRTPHRIKTYFMISIARDMQRGGKSNTITLEDLSKSIRSAQDFAEPFAVHKETSDEEISYFKWYRDQVKEVGEVKAVETLVSDVRTTGVLARDIASGPDSLYFPHKQFYEFFLALFCFAAVDQKISGESRGAYWTHFSMNNPCAPLLSEPQAKQFFIEMADERWWDRVFTVSNTLYAKIAVLVISVAANWVKLNRFIIDPKIVYDAFAIVRVPKLPRFVVQIIIPALIVSVVVVMFTEFTAFFTAFIVGISAVIVLALPLSIAGGNSITGLIQWYDLVKLKFGGDAQSHARRVLGPLTFWSVRTFDEYVTEQKQQARERALKRVSNPIRSSRDVD